MKILNSKEVRAAFCKSINVDYSEQIDLKWLGKEGLLSASNKVVALRDYGDKISVSSRVHDNSEFPSLIEGVYQKKGKREIYTLLLSNAYMLRLCDNCLSEKVLILLN